MKTTKPAHGSNVPEQTTVPPCPAPKRYTTWNDALGCYVVELRYKHDGSQQLFNCVSHTCHTSEGFVICKDSDLIGGEVIQHLAVLEMEAEQKDKEIELLRSRLQHLLRSKAVCLFDDLDPNTGAYKRDIKRLDSCVDFNLAMETEAQRKAKSEALADFHRAIAEAAEEFKEAAEKLKKNLRGVR